MFPNAVFNPSTQLFDLNLKLKVKNPLMLSLGGNISSSGFNQGFVGIKYQLLSCFAFTGNLDAQLGQLYSGLAVGSRIDFPSRKKWYMKADGVMQTFHYQPVKSLLSFTQQELYAKLCAGFPLGTKARLELGAGFASQTDYFDDKSQYFTGSAFVRIESNTLNDRMYPFEGQLITTSLQTLKGTESFISLSNAVSNFLDKKTNWIQFRAKVDKYLQLCSWFRLGSFAEAMYSNRTYQQNNTISIIQTPMFQPTPYSKTVYNSAFVANQFVSLGLKPILRITDQLQLREEAYFFVPYHSILNANNNSESNSKPQFMSETSLVYNFKLASSALFVSQSSNQWHVGLNIGILLFKPKFLE